MINNFFLIFILIILIIKFVILKRNFKIIKAENIKLSTINTQILEDNAKILEEKLFHLNEIKKLVGENEYLNRLLNQSDNIKKDFVNLTKDAVTILGNELSTKLFSMYKQENNEMRTISEHNIDNTSKKLQKEFERVVNMVYSLNEDIKKSYDSVDLIKKSLLSPIDSGKLSEITLENILKSSGLHLNLDYIIQCNFITDDQVKLRPDAIVFLPLNNCMIIDAKSSKFFLDNCDINNLIRTMNNHVKSLSNKDYANNILHNLNKKKYLKINRIVTLMFLPTEHIIEKIVNNDTNFMYKAWNNNIFPVGPSGLMNILSLAKFQISDSKRVDNYQIIIEEINNMLFSIEYLVRHSEKLGECINNVVNSYDKFAGSFNTNFLNKVKKLSKLGINSSSKKDFNFLTRFNLIKSQTNSYKEENDS